MLFLFGHTKTTLIKHLNRSFLQKPITVGFSIGSFCDGRNMIWAFHIIHTVSYHSFCTYIKNKP